MEPEDSLPSSSKLCLHLTSAIYPIQPRPHDLICHREQFLKNTNYKAPITQFHPATQHFLSFRSKYCPHHLKHQHPLFKFITSCGTPSLSSHETTNSHKFVCKLIFTLSDKMGSKDTQSRVVQSISMCNVTTLRMHLLHLPLIRCYFNCATFSKDLLAICTLNYNLSHILCQRLNIYFSLYFLLANVSQPPNRACVFQHTNA